MVKKKEKKIQPYAIANIYTTFNNTIITFSDVFGKTICWSSAGNCGLKGSRKKTAFAAQAAAKNIVSKAISFGVKTISIVLKGPGNGRETPIRVFDTAGFSLVSIKEKISVPYNGCRPPKKRRL